MQVFERAGTRPSLLAATVLAVTLIASGTWYVVTWGVENAVRQNAKLTAKEWALYLGRSLPELVVVLRGEPLNEEAQLFLEKAQTVGNVFRYKLFDDTGGLRLDSADLDASPEELRSLAQHNPTAAKVVRSGRPHLESEEGDGVDRPLYYAEAYYPLSVGDDLVGTIEVYVDQTDRAQQLRQQFISAAALVAVLATLGFLLPMLAFIREHSEKAAADAALAHAARHDSLTRLLNRFEFRNGIERRIETRPSGRFFVHFLDLDKFKDVNDTRGHAIGDELLRQVALRLEEEAGERSHVCRLGGDEFAFSGQGVESREEAAELARRTIAAVSGPYTIRGAEILIGASVGIAEYPADGQSTTELLRAADLALYEAKRRGRGIFCVFEPAMEEERTRRLALEQRLRRAVEREDFGLCYQPLYKLSGRELVGFEALLRLDGAGGVPVAPGDFIPIAEDTGLIVPLGKLVLQRACRAAAAWPERLGLAVNLSPVQFEEDGLVDAVRSALEASGLEPGRLELEVTERTLMSETDSVALQLDRLKDLGVSISLDDFGTGYSSLSYIWKFPFDKLKIDRSFVSKLAEGDGRSRQVLKTVVALGEVLGLGITAEGVETQGQALEIARLNVDFVQGFYYGHPMEPDVVTASLGSGSFGFAEPAHPGAGVASGAASAT